MCIAIVHLLDPDAPFGEFDVKSADEESEDQPAGSDESKLDA
jgi:hypothetical protein